MFARFLSGAAAPVAAGAVFIGASVVYHFPSLFAGAVSVEDDLKVFYFPLLVATAQALSQRELALWTPAVFGGYPLFADGEAGMLYPFHLALLPWLAPETALVALRLIHSVLAAVFTFALLRTLGTGRLAATVGGLIYAYSGFAAGQIIHNNVFHAMVWLPLQLCLVERAWRSTGGERVRLAVLGGAAMGTQALAVHVHITLMSALAIGLFVAYRWATGLELPRLARARSAMALRAGAMQLIAVGGTSAFVLGIVGLIGAGLAAVQLLPLSELGSHTYRGNGLDAAAASVNSLWWPDLATLLLPHLFDTAAGGYWGLWVKWETPLYVGVAPLGLAAIGLALGRGRHRAFFAGLGALGLWLAFGTNAPVSAWTLLHSLPGFEVLRSPGRFTLLFALATAVLAAYGTEWLVARRGRHARAALAVLLAGGALWLLIGAALDWARTYVATPTESAWLLDEYLRMPGVPSTVDGVPLNRERLAVLAAAALDPGAFWAAWQQLLVLATAVGVALWLLGPPARPVAASWMVSLIFVDLWLVGLTYHPYLRLEDLRPKLPPVLSAAVGEPFRVFTPPATEEKRTQVEPNRLIIARLHEANGYSSLEPDRHAAYVAAVQYADNHLLDLWNIRYLIRRNRPQLLPSSSGTSFHPQRPLFSGKPGTPGAGGTLLPDGGDARTNEVIVISALWDAATVPNGREVAQIVLHGADGQRQVLSLRAGMHVSDAALDVPGGSLMASHARAEVAFRYQREDPSGDRYGEQLYVARLQVDPPMTVRAVDVVPSNGRAGLQVYGIGLYNAATGEVTQARDKAKYRLVYRDDQILVYENAQAMPRAFLVPEARLVPPETDVLAQMVDGPFDPRTTALIEAPPGSLPLLSADASGRRAASSAGVPSQPQALPVKAGRASFVSYGESSVVIRTAADFDAVLVLTDTYYPGWVAEVDGRPTPILRTNYLFRGVSVPAGDHIVSFSFRPGSVMAGAAVSLATCLAVLAAWLIPVLAAVGRQARVPPPLRLPFRRARRRAEPMAELP